MRLDNSSTWTVDRVAATLYLSAFDVVARQALEEGPIDVCGKCYYGLDLDDDVAHPPYGNGVSYYCRICSELLTEEDE